VILAAAAQVFMEKGYSASAIDDIADRLHASKGRIYHYYRSKADLFLDVQRLGLETILSRVAPHAEGSEDAETRLHRMTYEHGLVMLSYMPYLQVSVQSLEMWRTGILDAEQREELAYGVELRAIYESLYERVIEEGIDQGQFRPVTVRLATKAVLGTLNWTSMWYRIRDTDAADERDTICRELSDFAVSGLLRR
jgi:AcrR family transcriptional regulator